MRPGEFVQGIMPMRHDDPTYDDDLRALLLGASVDTTARANLGPPVPLDGTLGHAHACMAYIGPEPLSERAVGAWSNVFPLAAETDPKRGIGLRVIRDEQGRAGDPGLVALGPVGLPVFDRAFLDGDEAIAVGTPHGSPAPLVFPIGGLPLALPLAEDALSLANYTTRAAVVTFGPRGVPGQVQAACRMSSALVAAARGGDNVAINGTRTGALIDLELARGSGGTITRGGTTTIETHRLDRVIVGGRGFVSDRHGDAAHISCEAPIIALDAPEFDGALTYERGYDDGAREGTIPHRVHRRFERVSGRWVEHVNVPVYQDDDPPDGPPKPPPEDPRDPGEPEVPPVPPETPPGGGDGLRLPPGIPQPPTVPLPPGEGTGGLVIPLPFDPFNPPRKGVGEGAIESSYNRPSAGSPHEWHAPGIAFRATPTTGGGDFRAPRGRMTPAQVARARSAPVALHIEGYGAETDGGRFVAAGNRGAASRRYAYAEGTAGGAVVLPPELGLEHIRDLQAAYTSELPSVSYLVAAPQYVRLAFATPDVSGRGVKSGFTMYQKGVANTLFHLDWHDSAGAATLISTWSSDGSLDLIGGGLTTTGAVNFGSASSLTLPAVVDGASLPTVDPGVAGRLWNNGGVVQVSS